MQHKGHNPSGKNIILHVGIPRRPQLLEEIQLDIIFAYLVELAPVRGGGCSEYR